MPLPHRRTRWMSLIALLVGLLWASPATATPFIATWNNVPNTVDPPPPSPFYDCPVWGGGGLICDWIWDQGLEVKAGPGGFGLPMYGDGGPFFDALGLDVPFESELTGGGYLAIDTNCRVGLVPCIHTFTPRNIVADVYSEVGPAGVSFSSSRGGLIKAPVGTVSVDFAGAEWTDITGMSIGIYLSDACGDPDSDLDCRRLGELALFLDRLTFDATPVPEPASLLLVGTGLLATLRRYRRG
jgi:hypothetical protein